MLAIELADLLENARPVPLLRNRVRVDKREVYRLVDGINETLRAEAGDRRRPLDKSAGFDLLQAAYDLREAVRDAYPVPLTDQVRLPGKLALELATRLRAAARL